MNKKILAALLSLGLILTACSEEDTNNNDTIESVESVEDTKEEPESVVSEEEPSTTTEVEEEKVESIAYEEAKVTRVVDGDTVEVSDGNSTYKLRLIGVNTPETVHPNKDVEFFGKEASDFTKEKLTDATIYLEKDVSDTDRYQRLLRYVWLEKPSNNPTEDEIKEKMFNAILVKEGYAYSSAYAPDIKHQELFDKLQKQAEESNAGLWNQEARSEFENKETEETVVDESQQTGTTNSDGSVIGITSTEEVKIGKRTFTADTTPNVIKGNANSMIYHRPGQRDYNRISVNNVVHFSTAADAEAADYRPAQR